MALDIMMPFYGRADHLRIAVESVLTQTSPDWRLTIVDDVYPDPEATAWARALEDPRVRVLRNAENLRPSRNYNKCAELAQTEFLVLMGCDDVLRPNYVARVGDLLAAHPDVDIVQPGVAVIDEAGHPALPPADRVKSWYRPRGRGVRVLSGEVLARSLLRGNWTYFPSIVWRRSRLASGFRTDLNVVQDLAMLLQIVGEGGSLLLDDEITFSYRRHRSSFSGITGPDGSKFAEERVVFSEAVERCERLGWARAARAARRHTSSRLNALSELPHALRARDRAGLSSLSRHAFGGLERPPVRSAG